MAKAAIFATKKTRKSTNEATPSTRRKMMLVVELLTQRRVRFSAYHAEFGLGFRSFQRDLQQVEKIGKSSGFQLSGVKDGEFVELIALDARTAKLNRDSKQLERLLVTMAEALGEPIVRAFGSRVSDARERDTFFSFVSPKLIEGTAVADICASLREAYASPNGRAAVRFRFPESGKKTESEREVEPYGILVRSGTFYLLGFDRKRRAWRTFAIHRFASKPVKAGTCTTTRIVPEEYTSEDVVGFFKGGKRIDVTVELTPKVAASATCRRWQSEQRVEKLADGRAQITFAVSDVDEVVRWSLGFGADARVIAPPEAVARAAAIASDIVNAYRGTTAV